MLSPGSALGSLSPHGMRFDVSPFNIGLGLDNPPTGQPNFQDGIGQPKPTPVLARPIYRPNPVFFFFLEPWKTCPHLHKPLNNNNLEQMKGKRHHQHVPKQHPLVLKKSRGSLHMMMANQNYRLLPIHPFHGPSI